MDRQTDGRADGRTNKGFNGVRTKLNLKSVIQLLWRSGENLPSETYPLMSCEPPIKPIHKEIEIWTKIVTAFINTNRMHKKSSHAFCGSINPFILYEEVWVSLELVTYSGPLSNFTYTVSTHRSLKHHKPGASLSVWLGLFSIVLNCIATSSVVHPKQNM